MTKNKILSISQQLLLIALFCYFILIDECFIYRLNWRPSFAFALAFFHIGTLTSLYLTAFSKDFSKEKEDLIFCFNMFVYTGSLALFYYHNCLVETNNLIQNYLFGLLMLSYSLILLFQTYSEYQNLKSIKKQKLIK